MGEQVLWVAGSLCLFESGLCTVVYSGFAAVLPCNIVLFAIWASTIRLAPGSERVPCSRLWSWLRPRVGRLPAVLLLATVPFAIWAIAQPEASFVMSPRRALRRLWLSYRLGGLFWGIAWTAVAVTGYATGEWDANGNHALASISTLAVFSLAYAATLSEKTRGRVLVWLGNIGRHDRANAAAVVSAVVGGLAAKEAFRRAQAHFLGISWSALSYEDFANTDLAGRAERDQALRARTQRLAFGQVDCFLSHSWHDPVQPKWEALTAWADRFRRTHQDRSPIFWLDKACIDQTAIAESLACLPVFLAGCNSMLVIAGPTYTQRLWCVMELFTFQYMGGDISSIAFLPISEGHLVTPLVRARVSSVPEPMRPDATEEDKAAAKLQAHRRGMIERRESRKMAEVARAQANQTNQAMVRSKAFRRLDALENSSGRARAMAEVLKGFETFDAAAAQCFKPEDKDALLGVIESGAGSIVRLAVVAGPQRATTGSYGCF